MSKIDEVLKRASKRMEVAESDLQDFFSRGEQKTYAAEEWLFHESTPRQWAGIVVEGEVEIVRGLHGSTKHLVALAPGALISEGAFLEDQAHANGAFTRQGATVWQMSCEQIEAFRGEKPELFYRIMARVAAGISERLRVLSQDQAGAESAAHLLGDIRLEHDSLGERELPEKAYYGVQTLRAMENFAISGVFVKNFEHMIEALAFVKKAAALANHELNVLDEDKMKAICEACDELLAGRLHDHFTVDMFQGGAGTSTNMNANEVIANRGLEIMGYKKGEFDHLHPNDHVNCSQSTNDAYPTSIKLAVLLSLKDLLGAMQELKQALEAKAAEFADVLKMGRTENQDAVPMTLGQEFSAYAVMIESAAAALERNSDEFHDINMGATAIGTGINSPPGYADLVTQNCQKSAVLKCVEPATWWRLPRTPVLLLKCRPP
jgi:aspartate ammonia-lyase